MPGTTTLVVAFTRRIRRFVLRAFSRTCSEIRQDKRIKNMGRRKIAIEKIEVKAKRQVTFSKRRQGLFKKAKDICVLSNSQLAIIVFSPGGKAYSFGHTDVETVINHFLNGSTPDTEDLTMLHCLDEIETKSKILQNMGQHQQGSFWWENMQVEETDNLDELERMKTGLEQVRENVFNRLGQLELSRGFTGFDHTVQNEDLNGQSVMLDQHDTLVVEDSSFEGISKLVRDDVGDKYQWCIRDDADDLPPFESAFKF